VGKNIKPTAAASVRSWVAEWVAFTQNDAWQSYVQTHVGGGWGHWKHYMTVCPHDATTCERWHYTWTAKYSPAPFTATNGRQVVTFELLI
jgi:hypothetical protein